MHIQCDMIWDFLKTHSLENLTVKNIQNFIHQDTGNADYGTWIFDHPTLTDMDLLRILFAELEHKCTIIPINNDFSKQDQIFDFLMSITDQYTPYKTTIQKLIQQLHCLPKHLGVSSAMGGQIAQNLFKRFGIKICRIHINQIDIFASIAPVQLLPIPIPEPFQDKAFFFLCVYFLKIWVQDNTTTQDETMRQLNTVLQIIEIL